MNIKITGNKCRVEGLISRELAQELDMELSYRVANYQFSPAFKQRRWDGIIHMLSPQLDCRVGFIPRIKEFFALKSQSVDITDQNVYEPNQPVDISKQLKKMKKELREHQVRAVDAALKNKIGIVRSATGSGKTLMIVDLVAKIGKPTMILVIGKDLLYQFHKLFETVFQQEIGIVGDGICNIKKINICSLWSVVQAFENDKKKKKEFDDCEVPEEKEIAKEKYVAIKKMVVGAKVLIMDEVHMASCQSVQLIAKHVVSEYSFGFSATNQRDDGSDLLIESIFGQVIIDIPASELIEKGYLVKPVIKFINVPKPKEYVERNYGQIYKKYVVENEARNELIVRAGKSMIEQGFSVLCLFKQIKHGKILSRMFNEVGINHYLLDGSDDIEQRQAVIAEVESGACKLIIVSQIFDIGIDIPCLSGLILCSGGKSYVRNKQRIGRVIRIHDGKDMAAVIDFNDRVHYLQEHSMRRAEIYRQEPGFEVHTSF